tara:strand:+ start:684 stop:1949 length:1266 start_codon:yes stop_codon:yes gene_type:complete
MSETSVKGEDYAKLADSEKYQLYSTCPSIPFLAYIPLFDDGTKVDDLKNLHCSFTDSCAEPEPAAGSTAEEGPNTACARINAVMPPDQDASGCCSGFIDDQRRCAIDPTQTLASGPTLTASGNSEVIKMSGSKSFQTFATNVEYCNSSNSTYTGLLGAAKRDIQGMIDSCASRDDCNYVSYCCVDGNEAWGDIFPSCDNPVTNGTQAVYDVYVKDNTSGDASSAAQSGTVTFKTYAKNVDYCRASTVSNPGLLGPDRREKQDMIDSCASRSDCAYVAYCCESNDGKVWGDLYSHCDTVTPSNPADLDASTQYDILRKDTGGQALTVRNSASGTPFSTYATKVSFCNSATSTDGYTGLLGAQTSSIQSLFDQCASNNQCNHVGYCCEDGAGNAWGDIFASCNTTNRNADGSVENSYTIYKKN